MPRFPLTALFLAVGFMLPATALELSELRLPLTRSDADKMLSKDYRFRVLEDITVRRIWELDNRTVSVDFSPKQADQALLVFIDYTRPVTAETAAADATAMLGLEPDSWKKLNPQRAKKLGMEAAEGFKLTSGRYCFREINEEGRVVRLAYYAGIPKEVRWDLADDNRDTGKTALGARSAAGSSEFLWQDEERRRGITKKPTGSSSLASAAAAAVGENPHAASRKNKPDMVARPEEPMDLVEETKAFASKLTPRHYALGGGALALLLLWRYVVRAREAKRRAMVANYIMNHGAIHTGGSRGGKRRKPH